MGDGFCWRAECLRTACFHLRKNQGIIVSANEIDFSALWRAVVAVEHLVADAAQMPGGDLLSAAA